MTPSRVVRIVVAFLLLIAIPSFAVAATTEFRVLFDVDDDDATGCTVNGMAGVDQVLVTQVTDGGGVARVTRTHREVCTGTVLGGAIDIVTTGWDAGWNNTNKLLTLETRIPFSAFGTDTLPSTVHVGFDASRNNSVHTSLANQDGSPIIIPEPPVRRRAIGAGEERHIVMDGVLTDWGRIKPAVIGLASNGTSTLRLLRILAWPDTGDHHLYFAATAYLGSDYPYADDNTYLRDPGQNLMVGAPGVLNNDAAANGATLSAQKVTDPTSGTVVLNADGSFTYSPNHPQLLTDDEFEYKAVGGGKESNVARVVIQVNQDENPVSPQDDEYTTREDKILVEPAPGVLANDDPNPTVLEATLATAPSHGTVVLNKDGGFTYAPAKNYFGDDTFVYNATKKQGADHGIGGQATVTIHIEPVNDAPSFTAGPNPVTTTIGSGPYSAQWATDIRPGPGNESGQTVNFIVSNNNNALFSVQPQISATGVLTFTHNGAPGTATVTVQLHDNGGTARNGKDTSDPVFFVINVTCGGTISVTNPANASGTASSPFSETFTQAGGVGATTFSLNSGTLPAGLTLAANGVLSGTPTQTGSFPITVAVTDSQGCIGVGPTYTLVIACQTITVTNPANGNGTANAAFSETFTQTGAIGTTTFTTASTLPAGLTLAANGVLSGTPTQTGSFPITVTATDSNGCTGTGTTYTIVIGCQTITVNIPGSGAGTVNAAFSQTFTQTGAIGTPAFALASGVLPAGLTLAANGNVSGTPLQTGSFPITVTVTDANGCTGTSATYTIIVGCQVITVTNPATTTGTVSAAFSQTFTQSNAVGGATFTLASGSLPAGLTLATNGLLSGTPTVTGSFPITVMVTDGNGCTGTSATYNLVIGCQTITVNNPTNATGPAGSPFSETFTQTGAVGGATFTTASTLPTGLTLSAAGVLSGTPMQGGTFPIVVTVTDGNGCTGTSSTYTLVITCPTITVTNPANGNGTASSPFSETFTSAGGVGTMTYTVETGVLPAGLTLAANGTLSGTPTQTGSFPITVTATDSNGCTGTGTTYTIVIGCQVITLTNPANGNGTASSPFSETFTQTGAIGSTTFTLASGVLPAGLTLATNGTLSGTPTQTGSFPITVTVTDSNGCTGTGTTYTIVIGCQVITVNNPATNTGTVSAPFSQTFTQTAAIGTATFTTASTLPAGLTLAANGTLSGTPTQTGSFPITVTVTDSNGCTGTSATYTLTIGCQTITVTNPANTSGTVSAGFSETFTQTGAVGTATFTTASTLPAGLTLATNGTLAGVPTQSGSFPIVVTVTDSNGCTGTSATYTLVIACQTITVTNPANATGPAGTPFSETFTQTGAVGGATFTTASTLPTGLTLSTAGVLSGTPMQGGTFPIVVTVTDGNGCTGTSATYSLIITCPTITVTNPVNNVGTSGVAFSETFTQSGGLGTITWSVSSGVLPAGISLAPSTGILSGTTNAAGSFPITVTATDQNGCTGTSATYTLVINCQTITVTNPGVNTGTVDAAFSQTFTQTGVLGTVTWSLASGALPAGITLDSSTGVLSGTPTVTGSFPITVTATDTNGCFGTGATYTLTINCQTITVTNPGVNTGTVDAPFSQTFTQTGAHATATFTTASTLPAGLTLATDGTLSGTPTVTGVFPIVVTVTDANGCTGTGTTYMLTIGCQTITVTNPGVNTGTVGTPFSQTFTQVGAHASATFTTASTLPAGLTLATNGTLSGTPTQFGTFPIVVTVTDANGCTGTGATYTLTVSCQVITVSNPANASGTVSAPFSEQFTQVGALGGATFTTASTLPTGLTLSTSGLLSGTPTQSGTFPITVTVTDGNGCTGVSTTYNLTIGCQTITVTNPATTTGTAGTAFTQSFTQVGAVGSVTFSTASTLPAGLVLQADGTLTGTPTEVGSFPIVVTVTDSNGCTGTGATYTLVIGCQTITITNANLNSVQSGTTLTPASDWTFTATGILGTATWTVDSGSLPAGITLSTAGVLSGSSTAQGSYPITVKVTDTNGCFSTSSYTLTVTCPVITPARTGGGTFPAAVFNTAYAGQSFTASGGAGPYTFAVTSGTFPTGLSLASNGTISGTPTQTGTYTFTITATDANLCVGSASFTIAVNPAPQNDTYSNLVNNTQAVITGGATTSPTTPFIPLTGMLVANDQPSGAVAIVAGTFATTQGGSVTIAVDGTFIYTPPVTATALASDTFTYTVASNTGSTPTPTQATATATLNLTGRVWYVKNNAAGGGNGQSQSPFNSTSSFTSGARATPDKPNDIIYIYNGDGTTTNQNGGVALLSGEQLIGEGVALVVNTVTLVPAGTKPLITNTAGDGVTLHNSTTVRGLTVTGTTGHGINGVNVNTVTLDTLTLQNAGAASAALRLGNPAGTILVTNTTMSNSPFGFALSSGTATTTVDATNTITAGPGQRSVSITALGAGSSAAIGATINDSGNGMNVDNNAAVPISFTGSQTFATTTNPAVSLGGNNAGTTISFSGTLGITTSTGNGFQTTAAGILNVSGTANITTGAAALGLSLNGMTVGGSGVTFNSINTTGATTGINLTNVTGTVVVNGGTLANGTTGIALQGASTSLTLAGVTINGPTTGITNTTNFGTLTIGASVSVSATTALNLNTGTVTGTFASVSSSGGTNGVNLNAVSGTWGTTAGALTGATGPTFNVAGTAAAGSQITWGGTITQNNASTAVTIAGHNRNVTFSNTITTGGTSTGIAIGTSSGTYLFNGTNTIAGSGGGIAIGASESGTITFSNASSINTVGTAFSIAGGGGAVSAAITYGGTITKASGGILISVDNLDSPGTLSMSHTPAAAGNINQNNTAAQGISIINSSSTNITISDASVSFQSSAAGFTASGNTGGTINLPGLALTGNGNKGGMLISGAGTINVNAGAANPSINLSAGNNAASKAIDGTATSFTGTLNLTNATITGNGTASADIVSLTGSTLGGTGSTISGANRALVLSGVALTNGAGMASITSTGGANGISLTNVTGGPYTISAGSLTSNSGASFLVSGGTSTITYAGTMTQSTAGQRVIDIQSTTGGTMNFTGATTSTGGGVFINATSNSAVSFRGGLSLTTTTNAAFTATAGGGSSTIEVCDENPCNSGATGALVNTITTTTGTALNVANHDITANNLEFRSINAGTAASGPANGIILNTTDNSGGLKVKGTGAAGTGGTIQKTTSDAISLTSTNKITLATMNVLTSAESGILGTTVNDLNLTSCTFTNNGDDSLDEGIKINNLGGSAAWSDLSVTGSAHSNVFIDNTSSTLTSFVISGASHFDSVGAAFGANSVLINIRGTATLTSGSITGATFQNNKPARGFTLQSQDTASVGDNVSNAFVVQNGTFTNNGLHASFEQSGSANLTFRFLNNGTAGAPMTMPNTPVGTSHAVNVFSSSASTGGNIRGRLNGNFIGNAGVAGSGSAIGNGIRVFIQGKTVATLLVDGNTIRQIPQARGIDIQLVGQLAAAQPIVQHDITVTNNDVNPQDSTGFPASAIYLAADNQGSPARMRSDVRGNTVPAGAAIDTFPTFLVVDEVVATAEAQLVDTGAASANCTAQLTSTNTGSASAAPGCALIAGPVNTPP